MEYLNVTPHDLTVVTDDGTTIIPASGVIARVSVVSEPIETTGPIPAFKETYGDVENLPDPEEGVVLIASALVCAAVPDREDVWHPGILIRDDAGHVIGCRGIARIF